MLFLQMLVLIHSCFVVYTTMIAVRIVASWFAPVWRQAWFYWLCRSTDPYLNLFRRMIPPIGGVLDLSPILAFLGLQLAEFLIYRLFF